MNKLLVLGLDSVPPELLYGPLLDKLPTFKKLFTQGVRAKLRTCDPPISTVQATAYCLRHRSSLPYQ